MALIAARFLDSLFDNDKFPRTSKEYRPSFPAATGEEMIRIMIITAEEVPAEDGQSFYSELPVIIRTLKPMNTSHIIVALLALSRPQHNISQDAFA